MKISSVSIAQSRQTSFQLEASELDSHIQNMRFQSPNRVKPLSNQEKIDEVTRRFRVSIAQSRQTSFQHANNAHAAILDKGAVSIAQSRQTSFQLRLIAYIKQRIDVVSIAQSRQTSFQRYVRNRPDFDNDVSIAQSRQTSFQLCFFSYNHYSVYMFQSPNRVKPLSNTSGREYLAFAASVSIAQSRQTSFQLESYSSTQGSSHSCFNRPIASNLFPTNNKNNGMRPDSEFQSPNRV